MKSEGTGPHTPLSLVIANIELRSGIQRVSTLRRVLVHPYDYFDWHNGTSGQDATTYSFFMSKYYYYASFRVTLRESNGGRVLARSEWTVNGAGEEKPDECVRGICPESVEPDTVVTK